MTLKERRRRRQRLILHWRMDPEGVAQEVAKPSRQVARALPQAYEAVFKPDSEFLIDLGKKLTDLGKKLTDLGLALEWLGPDGKSKPENLQFHEQIESALVKLLQERRNGTEWGKAADDLRPR